MQGVTITTNQSPNKKETVKRNFFWSIGRRHPHGYQNMGPSVGRSVGVRCAAFLPQTHTHTHTKHTSTCSTNTRIQHTNTHTVSHSHTYSHTHTSYRHSYTHTQSHTHTNIHTNTHRWRLWFNVCVLPHNPVGCFFSLDPRGRNKQTKSYLDISFYLQKVKYTFIYIFLRTLRTGSF